VLLLASCGPAPVAAPLADSPEWLQAQKTRQLWTSGENLGRAQAEDVERHLDEQPDDQVARQKLLTFYFTNGTRFYDPEIVVKARRKHILWLIAHHPEDPLLAEPRSVLSPSGPEQIADAEGYAVAKKLWLAAVAKPDVPVQELANAAELLSAADKPLAEKLLLQGQARDPQSKWPRRLGRLYAEALAGADAAYAKLARQKLEESQDPELLATAGHFVFTSNLPDGQVLGKAYVERALQLDPQSVPAHAARARMHQPADGSAAALARQAESSFFKGDRDAARKDATSALQQAQKSTTDPDYGTAIYQANMVLGMIAMSDHDRKSAVKCMLAAADAPSTEELAYYVSSAPYQLPGMLLADGERESVLQFLARFAKTCVADRKELLASADLIRHGQKPVWYPAAD